MASVKSFQLQRNSWFEFLRAEYCSSTTAVGSQILDWYSLNFTVKNYRNAILNAPVLKLIFSFAYRSVSFSL